MKSLKTIISLLVAFCLIATMSVVAFADDISSDVSDTSSAVEVTSLTNSTAKTSTARPTKLVQTDFSMLMVRKLILLHIANHSTLVRHGRHLLPSTEIIRIPPLQRIALAKSMSLL